MRHVVKVAGEEFSHRLLRVCAVKGIGSRSRTGVGGLFRIVWKQYEALIVDIAAAVIVKCECCIHIAELIHMYSGGAGDVLSDDYLAAVLLPYDGYIAGRICCVLAGILNAVYRSPVVAAAGLLIVLLHHVAVRNVFAV